MYIKMIFKRTGWNMPGNTADYMDDLFVMPAIVEVLPEDMEAGIFTPVRSQFQFSQPDTFCYYMDCGDLPLEKVKNVLEQFKTHYQISVNGLPAAKTCAVTKENEIITNMRVSLENAKLKSAERRPYLKQASISTVYDLVNALRC